MSWFSAVRIVIFLIRVLESVREMLSDPGDREFVSEAIRRAGKDVPGLELGELPSGGPTVKCVDGAMQEADCIVYEEVVEMRRKTYVPGKPGIDYA